MTTPPSEIRHTCPHSLVRIQVDIPVGMNDKLDQLKVLGGIPKRHVIKRALEELFKRGKNAI